jgi:hypothetical protein
MGTTTFGPLQLAGFVVNQALEAISLRDARPKTRIRPVCASFFAACLRWRPRLVLQLEPLPLFRGNRSRPHAEQEESLASVKDDEVVECTPLGYALLFPGSETKTVALLRQRNAAE